MLAALIQILGGSFATSIARAIEARENAKTDQERIAADERVKELQAKQAVMVAEAGGRFNTIVRAVFALPVAAYYGKIFLVDKVLGMGSTDPLSPELTQVSWTVIGFYFLTTSIEKFARRR